MQQYGQGPDVHPELPAKRSGPAFGRESGRRATLDEIRAAGTAAIYNIAAVGRLSGVLPATLRAWERRYGCPTPRRSESNRRGYSDQDVLAVRWLRERLDEGLTIRTAVALLSEQLAEPIEAPAAGHPTEHAAGHLSDALLAFDALRADRILGEAFALHPVEIVCLDVLQPVMAELGDGWEAGTVDVSQEHFASAYVRQRLTSLLQLTTSPRPGRLAVTASAPGDWHELGILTVALFLARHGWRVVHLGGNLPTDDLLACLDRLGPDAVVISATTAQGAASLSALAARLAEQPRPRPVLGFGGQIFEADTALRESVPALYLGPTAATAVERLDRALATAAT